MRGRNTDIVIGTFDSTGNPVAGTGNINLDGTANGVFWLGGDTQVNYALKSLKVAGDINIAGSATTTLNILVCNDSSEAAAANAAKIYGNVNLQNSGSQLYFYGANRRSNYQYVEVGGVNGNGKIMTDVGNYTDSGTTYYYGSETTLVLNNTTDQTLNGACVGWINKTTPDIKYSSYVHLLMQGTASQSFVNESNLFGDVTVKSGKLFLAGTARDATITGGALGALAQNAAGTLTLSSLTMEGGAIEVDISGEALGFANDLIVVSGEFNIGDAENCLFDFNAVGDGISEGHEYTIVEFGSTNITADDLSSFNYNANGYNAEFKLGDGTLGVIFTAVPEPSVFALSFGTLAVGFAAARRRRA